MSKNSFKDRIEKAKKWGNVTGNGIAYEWELAGSEGASFLLLREPHHTDEDIKQAKRYLCAHRDVVSISIERDG